MEDLSEKFVLFAHARSGSSNLLKALQLHPSLSVAEEPFHHNYGQWNPEEPNYVDIIKDQASLEDQLSNLFQRYDGIKILDYQLPEALYDHLLLTPELKIIALQRKNLLQSVVSGLVAEQTGVWKAWNKTSVYPDVVQPLSIDILTGKLTYARDLRLHYNATLERKDSKDCLHVTYEDLYNQNPNERLRHMSRVYHFLGLNLSDVPAVSLDTFLNPKSGKVNQNTAYSHIPNAQEINDALGSDELGWLF